MTSRKRVDRLVQRRAGNRCEYCHMHQSLQGGTFHVEHVTPSARGGATTLSNLAWACPGCNLKKSDHVEATDPQTGDVHPLFNPRTDRWGDHFEWSEYEISPRTAIARATIALLDLNHSRRVRIRHAEALFGLFPINAE